MKKTLLALAAMSVSMSIFAAGCGFAGKAPEKENSTSKPAVTQEQKMQEVEKNMSSARNTPIVKAAKKVGPTVVGITNKALVRDYFNRTQLVERASGQVSSTVRMGLSRPITMSSKAPRNLSSVCRTEGLIRAACWGRIQRRILLL